MEPVTTQARAEKQFVFCSPIAGGLISPQRYNLVTPHAVVTLGHINSTFVLQRGRHLLACSFCFYKKKSFQYFLLQPKCALMRRKKKKRISKAYLAYNPTKTLSWVLSCFCVLPEVFENLKSYYFLWCVCEQSGSLQLRPSVIIALVLGLQREWPLISKVPFNFPFLSTLSI